MTNSANRIPQDEDVVERLLAKAEPRPAPPPDVTAAAHAAVKREWQQSIRRRKRWRYAVAASAVLAALVWFTASIDPPLQAVAVASVDKVNGEFSFLRDDGIIEYGDGQAVIMSGETIMTGNDDNLGLGWHSGGSLRLDANTSVRFLAPDQVELLSGRVYFDSGQATAPPGSLVIHTDLGDLRHLGTQYMVDVRDSDILRVSVREGSVAISGIYRDARIGPGKQVVLHGDREPVISSLATYSSEWQWTEAAASAIDADGKTFFEILQWVSRETGLSYRFASDAAMDRAQRPLSGVDGKEPMPTLRVGAAAATLTVEQIDGVIVVSERSP